MLVTQWYLTFCDPMDCSLAGSSVHGIFQARVEWVAISTGVGCHFLLQGIFPTQGSNPGLLHCTQILYHLSHQQTPKSFLSETFPVAPKNMGLGVVNTWLSHGCRICPLLCFPQAPSERNSDPLKNQMSSDSKEISPL